MSDQGPVNTGISQGNRDGRKPGDVKPGDAVTPLPAAPQTLYPGDPAGETPPQKKSIFNRAAKPLLFLASTALITGALWFGVDRYNEAHKPREPKKDKIELKYTSLTTGYNVQRTEAVFIASEGNTLTAEDLRDFAAFTGNLSKMPPDAIERGMMKNLHRVLMLAQDPAPVKLRDGTIVYHEYGVLHGLGGGPSMILKSGEMLWTTNFFDATNPDQKILLDLLAKFYGRNEKPAAADAENLMRFLQESKTESDRAIELARLSEIRLSVRDSAMSANRGEINGPFFVAAQQQGLPAGIIQDLIKLYSYNVDFQRDFDVGDRFEVIYEGAAGGRNNVAYAKMTIDNKAMEIYRFTDEAGSTDYYDASGRSLKVALMKTPIDGAHISSGFGMRRHPISGYNRLHKGIDFAARSGTPIYAAGDGVIEVRAREGGYGNYIKITHSGGYQTAYAHMSAYASQKKGDIVKQGDIIGYVGSSGRSTGPHLHYEVLKDGKHINPRDLKLDGTGRKLTGQDLAAFRLEVSKVQEQLGKLGFGPVVRGVVTRADINTSRAVSMNNPLNGIRPKGRAPGRNS